jgi:hypothetical protein
MPIFPVYGKYALPYLVAGVIINCAATHISPLKRHQESAFDGNNGFVTASGQRHALTQADCL